MFGFLVQHLKLFRPLLFSIFDLSDRSIIRSTQDCRNLPFGGRATWGSRVRLPRKENARSRHQRLFEVNVGKSEMCGLRTLIVKGSGVVFTHGEGISTPRFHHKGRQPLIKCANMTSKCFIFPFFMSFVFLCFLCFFVFFIFLWSTRVFPSLLRILNCDEKIKPT